MFSYRCLLNHLFLFFCLVSWISCCAAITTARPWGRNVSNEDLVPRPPWFPGPKQVQSSVRGPQNCCWVTHAWISRSKVIKKQRMSNKTPKICIDLFSISLHPGAQRWKKVKTPTSIGPNLINMISQEALAATYTPWGKYDQGLA